jgi:hypothetical protein
MDISAYIAPHPCDEDGDIEPDWFSWIPGFNQDDDADGAGALFNDDNLSLYDTIELEVTERVKSAFQNLIPLFKDYYIKNIYVRLDIAGLTSGNHSLAGYNYAYSKPHCGIYQFTADQVLLHRYLHNHVAKNSKENYTWEHELLHLLDYRLIEKASVYKNSEDMSDLYKYFLLKFREEGLAELYYLLHTNYSDITSVEQAKEQFLKHLSTVKQCLAEQDCLPTGILESYSYYELGPWLMLDMLRNYEGMFHQEMIDEALDKLKNKQAVDKEQIFEIITIALRVDISCFLQYCKTLDTHKQVHL